MLSITTDYQADKGNPKPYLRRIAEAGFTHIHWCHHWNTDFVYVDAEIDQIATWLKDYHLRLNDVHGSEGVEKSWVSSLEHERLAGVALIKNRIDFTERLGGDAVVMHIYHEPEDPTSNTIFWSQLRKSLDTLEPYAVERGVRIAVENLFDPNFYRQPGSIALADLKDNFDTIDKVFAKYGPDFLGLCYDSGHANMGPDRMHRLEPLKERLIALHLHDNDGTGDHHRLLFSDTIDWPRLANIIAQSAYDKPLSFEVSMKRSGIEDEGLFLAKAYETGERFREMVGH